MKRSVLGATILAAFAGVAAASAVISPPVISAPRPVDQTAEARPSAAPPGGVVADAGRQPVPLTVKRDPAPAPEASSAPPPSAPLTSAPPTSEAGRHEPPALAMVEPRRADPPAMPDAAAPQPGWFAPPHLAPRFRWPGPEVRYVIIPLADGRVMVVSREAHATEAQRYERDDRDERRDRRRRRGRD